MIPLNPEQAQLPTSIALGSFDGLHSGHQSVINTITKNSHGIPTVVSFWPHPREVLFGESRLRLDLPSEKAFLLHPLGIQQLVLIPFNSELAEMTPDIFFRKILVQKLQAKQIAIGENFKFGKDRKGDASTLKNLAIKENIEVCIVPIIKDELGRMSSSRIRDALKEGNIQSAKKLLNRPYSFEGKVVKGKGIGNTIGWPTANLEVDGRKFLPALGVYAAWVSIKDTEKKLLAVMNLGPQPTIDPKSPSAVEVHLLDKNIDLLGKLLRVEPVMRIRSQERFPSIEHLRNQIAIDAMKAKSVLLNH